MHGSKSNFAEAYSGDCDAFTTLTLWFSTIFIAIKCWILGVVIFGPRMLTATLATVLMSNRAFEGQGCRGYKLMSNCVSLAHAACWNATRCPWLGKGFETGQKLTKKELANGSDGTGRC